MMNKKTLLRILQGLSCLLIISVWYKVCNLLSTTPAQANLVFVRSMAIITVTIGALFVCAGVCFVFEVSFNHHKKNVK